MRHLSIALLICLTVPTTALAQDSAPPPPAEPITPTPSLEVDARPPKPFPPPQPKSPRADTISILFTSDIYGRFAWPGCNLGERPIKGRADISHLITAVKERKKALQAAGEPEPVLISAGSVIRPDVMGNHLFSGGSANAGVAVDLLKDVGFDGVSVGSYDFGSHPDNLRRYLELMAGAKVPLLAANVTCEEADDFRCKHLGVQKERYLLLERGGLKVAVYSLVREDMASRILERSRGTMAAADPLETARALNKKLRVELKADLVVLIANLNTEGDAPMPVIKFLRKLGKDAPDLVIADTLYDRDNEDFIGQIRPHKLPPIVGTGRFGQHLGRAAIRYKREGGKVVVSGVDVTVEEAAVQTPDKAAALKVGEIMKELCNTVSVPTLVATGTRTSPAAS